jgi:hypothetical protein
MAPGLRILLRALIVWALFILAESAQGALRRVLFGPEAALIVRQLSTGLGVIVLIALTRLTGRWLRLRSATDALSVGLLWATLTVAFEVGLGRSLGLSWARIAEDYDLSQGGLMGLGLAALALTPWVTWRLQRGRLLIWRKGRTRRASHTGSRP